MKKKRSKKAVLFAYPKHDNGYEGLAYTILAQAVMDWKKAMYGRCRDGTLNQFADERGYKSPREELLAFFDSSWCEELLGMFNFDYERFLALMRDLPVTFAQYVYDQWMKGAKIDSQDLSHARCVVHEGEIGELSSDI